jgi:hypothetical protein
MSKTKVFVCKKCKKADCLVDILKRSNANVALVGCQKICAGPVAGIELSGRMEWFSRIDTAKRIAGLHMLIERKEKRPVKPLEKRRVVKRSGRAPRNHEAIQ